MTNSTKLAERRGRPYQGWRFGAGAWFLLGSESLAVSEGWEALNIIWNIFEDMLWKPAAKL